MDKNSDKDVVVVGGVPRSDIHLAITNTFGSLARSILPCKPKPQRLLIEEREKQRRIKAAEEKRLKRNAKRLKHLK